jgi:hypothetical protein
VPIARYFILRWRHACGFVVHPRLVSAKNPPAMVADQVPTIDRAIIRIKSARKWPEKVVLDTSHPPITPPAVEEPPTAEPVRRLPSDEAGNQSNLEAMAQLKPDTQPAAVDRPTSQVKRGVARTARSKRRTTRRLARAEAGGCCQFGCIHNGQTSSNAMSRRRAASSWPMDRLALDRQELKDGRVLLVRTEVRVKPRRESAGSSSDSPSIRNAPMHLKEGSVP